jgi:hypothetical protein
VAGNFHHRSLTDSRAQQIPHSTPSQIMEQEVRASGRLASGPPTFAKLLDWFSSAVEYEVRQSRGSTVYFERAPITASGNDGWEHAAELNRVGLFGFAEFGRHGQARVRDERPAQTCRPARKGNGSGRPK